MASMLGSDAMKMPSGKKKCAKCGKMTGDIRGKLCGDCAFPEKKKKNGSRYSKD